MRITREFIEANRTARGGWTYAQIASLGETWPPKTGWIMRVVNRDLTQKQVADFLKYATREPAGQRRKTRAKIKNDQAVARLEDKLRAAGDPRCN